MDPVTKLYMLLEASHRLVGHPRFKRLAGWVNAQLAAMDEALVPIETPSAKAPTPAPVYPRNSGMTETDTESVPTPADRRA